MIPSIWRDFLGRHPGPPPAGWTFNGEATARRVALHDGVYLILAERAGPAFILCRVEPPAAGLFYLSRHDGHPEELQGDVENVITAPGPAVR